MKKIEDYLVYRIVWNKVIDQHSRFKTEIDGVICSLKMNNFPEEALYTFSVGNESIDIDDTPVLWDIPL